MANGQQNPLQHFETCTADACRKYSVLLWISLVVILVLVVFVVAQEVQPKNQIQVNESEVYAQGYREGFSAARKGYTETASIAEASVLEGSVTKISSSELNLYVTNVISDKTVDGVGVERRVRFDDGTEVTIVMQLSDAAFKEKQNAYFAKYQSVNDEVAPPSPFVESEGTISDIKVGDVVAIEDTNGSNIALSPDFVAGTIRVYRRTMQ